MALPDWKPLTGLGGKDEKRGPLLGALLTTFDPPDPVVLIEEYLPAWLGLENSYADGVADRLGYFAELESSLSRLKGRIAIISSPGEIRTSAEGWIWNYIHCFEVGATRAAVQHAKLWMFHRAPVKTDGRITIPETIEIVVSSANLTRHGLRYQIQAGWRCVAPLVAQGAEARAKTWGILPEFLTELGISSRCSGPKKIYHWRGLLRRCECSDGVKFIASVPGEHSAASLRRQNSAWGAAALRASWTGNTTPSRPSRSELGVEPLEFDAGVGSREVPIGFGVMLISMGLPSGDLSFESWQSRPSC